MGLIFDKSFIHAQIVASRRDLTELFSLFEQAGGIMGTYRPDRLRCGLHRLKILTKLNACASFGVFPQARATSLRASAQRMTITRAPRGSNCGHRGGELSDAFYMRS